MSETAAGDSLRSVPATSGSSRLRLRALREVSPRELRALLDQEIEHWDRQLAWDFTDVARAVADGVAARRLDGSLLDAGGEPIGYCYLLDEGRRLVVGSVFVRQDWRDRGIEERLVESVVSQARRCEITSRIEGQTLFCTSEQVTARLREAGFMSTGRLYMTRPPIPPRPAAPAGWRLAQVGTNNLGGVAQIVHMSHVGTPDATFNSTYASVASCREFVESLVLRSGCGSFDADASFIAFGAGGPEGSILCTRVGRRNGHVCQVSVVPAAQGRGLGTLLMETALAAHARNGLGISSLSVTEANEGARSLYERLGFQVGKRFQTYVWSRGGRPASST